MNIKISVRDLVEFVYRSGSIDASYHTRAQEKALQEGIRIHNKVQKQRAKESKLFNTVYEKEKTMKCKFEKEGFTFNIKGRIDGVIYGDNSLVIEELKSTSKHLKYIDEPSLTYLAQLKMYGYMFAKEHDLKKITLHLTYIYVHDESTKVFDYTEDFEVLEKFFIDVIDKYLVFAKLEQNILNTFLESSKKLSFPHKSYRKNQYQLMGSIYRTIESKKNIFVEAPTGTGKTISTIFPSIKAIENKLTSKVFYATAKTITRTVALESLNILKDLGLKMPSIILLSKEKSCPKDEVQCNPTYCEYAKGHFDRINDALLDIMSNETLINTSIVSRYAEKHKVCPYEFALDITNFCYFIVCDYNNVYNPKSMLKRYFTEGGNYSLLFDEAHNLHDRSLDMYSVTFSTETLKEIKLLCLGTDGRTIKLVNKVQKHFDAYNDLMEPFETIVKNDINQTFTDDLFYLKKKLDEMCELNHKNKNALIEKIFVLLDYLRIAELYSKNYKTLITRSKKQYTVTLQCLDASPFLSGINAICDGVVYFSATLTPIDFYRHCYGSLKDDYTVKLSSPFNEENCLYLIDDTISTYYKSRNKSIQNIAEKIYASTKEKVGNYFIFFNSYEHLNQVLEMYNILFDDENTNIVVQSTGLTEKEKTDFLETFQYNPSKTTLAFLVLGGMFSEGIDLVGEKLIGVIVVGVGLPKISVERELMKDYYKDLGGESGFDYAYTYNGISKVLQGFGRLIRSDTDKGFVLLMDIRYNTKKYLDLLPFNNYYLVKRKDQIQNLIKDFWANQ